MTPASAGWLRMYTHYDKNRLREAGLVDESGILNAIDLEAMECIDATVAEIVKEQREHPEPAESKEQPDI